MSAGWKTTNQILKCVQHLQLGSDFSKELFIYSGTKISDQLLTKACQILSSFEDYFQLDIMMNMLKPVPESSEKELLFRHSYSCKKRPPNHSFLQDHNSQDQEVDSVCQG